MGICWLRGSVEQALPIGRHLTRRPGRRLLEWVMLGRSQGRSLVEVAGRVVKEPFLARLVASNYRVIGVLGVGSGMLTRRRVAATDVSALCAASQVEPPSSRLEAVGASVATGRHARVDRVIRHDARISGRPFRVFDRSDLEVGGHGALGAQARVGMARRQHRSSDLNPWAPVGLMPAVERTMGVEPQGRRRCRGR
jgi:hypothetical protein